MKIACAAAIGAAALAAGAAVAATTASAQSYSYQGPSYSYTRPSYSYQPPPYSYQPPSYSYEPPGYVYTPPGMYRRGYHANTPDYNQAYQYPPSLYGDPRSDAGESQRRRNLYSPYYNRSGNPRNPSDVWSSPYDSPAR
jgi:hypothetical protein